MPEKGVDLYVDVVKNIANKFPDWKFDLIGSYRLGDNKNVRSFDSEITNKFRNISDKTEFYGFQSPGFVEEKMKSASIVIIPSIWEEPFGLVAAEAMSHGAAIIASNVGGIPEIVGKNGVLIKDINRLKLQNELQNLMIDDNKRKAFQKLSWNNFKHFSKTSSKKLDNYRNNILQSYFINF